MTEKYNMPDERGHFGPYGGMFVAETLIPPIQELNAAYQQYLNDPEFMAELDADLKHYVGRPSPLYHAERWSRELGGAQIYLKREDLNHTGAHKINNTVGRLYWLNAWVRPVLLLKPEPVSMVWRQRRLQHGWDWSVWFTWALLMLHGSL